jgi:pimeloyl-ACP methyl ester carboxylesterase
MRILVAVARVERIVRIAVVACMLAAGAATAQTAETMRALQDLLAGAVERWNGQRLLFGDLRPPMIAVPEKNAGLAALMDRARREDTLVGADDALFSDEMIATGLWQAGFFLDTYGTALFLDQPYDPGRIPLVLVHGINGSPRDFAEMRAHFADSPYQPVAFDYPSGMALADASAQLASRIGEYLGRHGVPRFAVIGHSMGGLVVKGLLDRAESRDLLPAWRVFVSIASPWAGIDAARHAHRLPRHPASWDDLVPGSAFLQRIHRTRFPDDVPFYLFFGARSDSRIMAALGNNDGVLTLASVLDSPVGAGADDVFGFYADHTGLLADPVLLRRLAVVLAAAVGGPALPDPELPRR